MFSKPNHKPDDKSHSQFKQDKEVQAFFQTHSTTKSGLANRFGTKTSSMRLGSSNKIDARGSTSSIDPRTAIKQGYLEQFGVQEEYTQATDAAAVQTPIEPGNAIETNPYAGKTFSSGAFFIGPSIESVALFERLTVLRLILQYRPVANFG